MASYDSNGNIKYIVVSPSSTSFGLFNADGYLRVVDATYDNGRGIYANNGAIRVNLSKLSGFYDSSGALTLAYLFPRSGAWFKQPSYYVNNVSPSLAMDFVKDRYMANEIIRPITDLLSRSGGTKFVKFSDGTWGYIPVNTLAYDYDSGRRRMILEGSATNLLYPSASPSSPFVATVSAQYYTLSIFDSGSVTLSGAHSATLNGTGTNQRTTYTFTPSAGSLTLTPSGSVTKWQLEVGASATSYIETTSSAVTRVTDVCQLTPLASSLFSATGPCTLVIRGSIGKPNLGNNTFIAGSSTLLRTGGNGPGGKGALVAEGSINFTIKEDTFNYGQTNLGIAYRWNGSSRAGSVNGSPIVSHTSSIIADTTIIYLGTSTGNTATTRQEFDELLLYLVNGSNSAIVTQAHTYVP